MTTAKLQLGQTFLHEEEVKAIATYGGHGSAPRRVSPAEVEEKEERTRNRSKRFKHPSFVPGRFVFAAAKNL